MIDGSNEVGAFPNNTGPPTAITEWRPLAHITKAEQASRYERSDLIEMPNKIGHFCCKNGGVLAPPNTRLLWDNWGAWEANDF
ncbi:hypothetical protein IVB18_06050 [Bradyrhizobium sp. 186]|uniref:hypothetical protein n=1 Tax=Bradyrhizobium sp. 186 TaxID=2782654 RepID=UPI002000C123|nr:hypothetical protein [Bradyrhizobium sp. 186]UPK36895.1 hypothetical protein IVB18_06050 [Bradyrhizobium sp. 186]